MLVHVILELQSKPDKLEEVKGILKNGNLVKYMRLI